MNALTDLCTSVASSVLPPGAVASRPAVMILGVLLGRAEVQADPGLKAPPLGFIQSLIVKKDITVLST